MRILPAFVGLCAVLSAVGAAAATSTVSEGEPRKTAAGLAEGVAAMKRGDRLVAFEMMKTYAEAGYRVAQVNLASLYLHGQGTPRDPNAAVRWYEEAAAQGHPAAYGGLGAIHQHGWAGPRDATAALAWYRKGAAAGDTQSLFGLARMYHEGDGVRRSEGEAAKWYRMAADRGHGKAQLLLGVMCAEGRGVPQDLVEAHMWFELAQHRLPPGQSRERARRGVDHVEAAMTPDQIGAARRMTRNWKPAE
jgi:TPR repeat protein